MKKVLAPLLSSLLLLSIAGNFIAYKYVYTAFDKYNDSRLDPIGLNFRPAPVIADSLWDVVLIGDSHARNWDYKVKRVLNLGIPSQTSSQIKLRSDLYKSIRGKKLIIVAGGNDLKSMSTNLERKPEIVRNCLACISQIVDNHKARFEEVYLVTIPPAFHVPFEYRVLNSKKIDEAHQEINVGIKALAQEKGVHCIDAYSLLEPCMKKEQLSIDGIHMNKKAYNYLESAIKK